MANRFGEAIDVEIYGGSHEEKIGVKIAGLPAGRIIDGEALQAFLDRRAPGKDPWSTSRKEPDRPVFLSGVREGGSEGAPAAFVTTGEPLEAVIYNKDTRPGDYARTATVPRPAHADYPAWVKYGSIPSGGGPFSARMTAPLCIAGGILLQWLEENGIHIKAGILSIGKITGEATPVPTREMQEAIAEAKAKGDSLGGLIQCEITGLPAGAGEPIFGSLESRICQTVFAVPAVKGIEFGAGFRAAEMTGSENNDPYCLTSDGTVHTRTNHHGGILGGLSSGMPLVFRVAMKPTPSIAMEQDSVDLAEGREVKLQVLGRHDPCIVPRAVPCIEAAAALAMGDVLLEERKLWI